MAQKVSLKLWVMPNGGYDTTQIMENEIENFERSHPNIKIEFSVIPWSQAWEKIMAAGKAKQLPDVFQIGNTWTKTLAAIDALEDITDRVHEVRLKDKFNPACWATCEIKDSYKVYALPWFVDVRMFFFRKDFFEKAGLDPNGLDNWESFKEICRALKGFNAGEGPIDALGVCDLKDQGLVHDVAPWIWASGGDFLTADGNEAMFHKEEALRGIKFYFDLMQEGYAPISDRRVPGVPYEDFFIFGKYGMFISNTFVIKAYLAGFFGEPTSSRNPEIVKKFGVALLPSGPHGRFTFFGGSNLAISNYSSHQTEAWQLLKFLTSDEFQVHQYKELGALPSVTEVFNSLFNHGTEQEKVLVESYRKHGRSYLQVEFWASIEFILVELFGKIIDSLKAGTYNEGFLRDEVSRAAEEINYILSL